VDKYTHIGIETQLNNSHLQKFFVTSILGHGYNRNWALYRLPLTWPKEFLLFYMCQLWALKFIV